MIVDQHELRVYSGSTELDPLENAGTLTADRGWSPFVQGRLTVRAPASDALTAPGTTIKLELTQRFGDSGLTRDLTDQWCAPGRTLADLTTLVCGSGRTVANLTTEQITTPSWNSPVIAATGRTFTMVITDRTRTRDEHSLQLASLEALVQDWVWYKVTGYPMTFVDLTVEGDTTTSILNGILAAQQAETSYALPEIVRSATPVLLNQQTHTIANGQNTIGYLDPLNIASRHRIFSNGGDSIVHGNLDQADSYSITIAPASNLIDWEVTDQRSKPTIVRFTGSPDLPTSPAIYSSLAFPSLNAPHEAYIDSGHIYRDQGLVDGVTGAIAVYLNKRGIDESPLRLTTVNNYAVQPGSPITYTLEAGDPPVLNSVDAITWQLGGRWEMDIWV